MYYMPLPPRSEILGYTPGMVYRANFYVQGYLSYQDIFCVLYHTLIISPAPLYFQDLKLC